MYFGGKIINLLFYMQMKVLRNTTDAVIEVAEKIFEEHSRTFDPEKYALVFLLLQYLTLAKSEGLVGCPFD